MPAIFSFSTCFFFFYDNWLNLKGEIILKTMKLFSKVKKIGPSQRKELLQIYSKQAAFIRQATSMLCKLVDSEEESQRKLYQKEVKSCEIKGDAILAQIDEQIYETVMTSVMKSDLQAIAMSMDDFLDNIDSAAHSILLYHPDVIADQLKDIAQFIETASMALEQAMQAFPSLPESMSELFLQCERITELEHETDKSYAEYIEYLFQNETDAIRLMKYKNIAEAFEITMDSAKAISDYLKKILIRYSAK